MPCIETPSTLLTNNPAPTVTFLRHSSVEQTESGFCQMSDIGVYTIFARAVALIRSDATYGPRMSNCWLPAATWVEVLRRTGHVDPSIIINARKFNAAMSKSRLFGSAMNRFDGSNPTGAFRIDFQHQFFYYFTDQARQVQYPRTLNGA